MTMNPLNPAPFSATSRYYGIDTAQVETATGQTIAYLKRRFLPPPRQFSTIQEYRVQQGDRPDLVAAQYLEDAEQFWRICDANGVMHPDELTDTVDRRVRITLPEGIPGYPHA